MLGYFYDSKNYRFSGVAVLQRNPKRKDEFLLAPNCTLIEPPQNYGPLEHPIFNADLQAWELGLSDYALELEAQKEHTVTSWGTPLYEKDINGNWIERDFSLVEAEDAAKEAAFNYENSLRDLKSVMDSAIIEKGMEITKGTSIESVQAFAQAFQLRASKASQYVNAGLKVYYPIDGYNLLDALDTEAKIADYYSKILIELDLFRETKIAEYIAAKALLTPPN